MFAAKNGVTKAEVEDLRDTLTNISIGVGMAEGDELGALTRLAESYREKSQYALTQAVCAHLIEADDPAVVYDFYQEMLPVT